MMPRGGPNPAFPHGQNGDRHKRFAMRILTILRHWLHYRPERRYMRGRG